MKQNQSDTPKRSAALRKYFEVIWKWDILLGLRSVNDVRRERIKLEADWDILDMESLAE